MKTIKLLALFICIGTVAFAQGPEELNYQGVARNTAGQPLANQAITLRLSILHNSATGTAQYRERHNVTTNDYGLYNVAIGTGTTETGTMAGVTWGSGSKFLEVEIDPAGGTSYTSLGANKLLSVPYALYAASGNPGPIGATGPAGPIGPTGPAGNANITGTTNNLIKFTGATTGGNSLIEDDGTTITLVNAVNNGSLFQVRNTGTTGNNRMGIVSVLGAGGFGLTSGSPSAIYANGRNEGHAVKAYAAGTEDAIWAFQNNAGAAGVHGRGAAGADGVTGYVYSSGSGNAIQGTVNSPSTGTAGYFDGGATGTGIRSLTSNSNAGSAGYFTSNASGLIDSGIVRIDYLGSDINDHIGLFSRSVAGTSSDWGIGIRGEGGFRGVEGIVNRAATGTGYGLYGTAITNSIAYGVRGYAGKSSGSNAGTKYGVYGTALGGATNWAGYFAGNVNVTGNLSKGGGTFKIDHPSDPENKYLYHSFVESPDMMNIYNGNATTNTNGEVVVSLPTYFDDLNIDFRYQLTPIGQLAQAIVLTEISGNTFTIKTDKPNVKVSWQVTGVRNDKWAQKNRVIAEVEKEEDNIGLYLHAAEYDLPKEKSIDWNTHEKPLLERETMNQE